jgi:hypothetical protein
MIIFPIILLYVSAMYVGKFLNIIRIQGEIKLSYALFFLQTNPAKNYFLIISVHYLNKNEKKILLFVFLFNHN